MYERSPEILQLERSSSANCLQPENIEERLDAAPTDNKDKSRLERDEQP